MTAGSKEAGLFGSDIQDLIDFMMLPNMEFIQNGTASPGPLERDLTKLLRDGGSVEGPDC